jgi:NADPH:quinone reductase-like Zn-dependent oxidoreductase
MYPFGSSAAVEASIQKVRPPMSRFRAGAACSGTNYAGTAFQDLGRHLGLKAIGTCSAKNMPVVERFGATAVDCHAGDFVTAVRDLTSGRQGGAGVEAAFDAIGGGRFARSFACLAPGGMLVGYGSQTMAIGGENMLSAGLGLARLKLWSAVSLPFDRPRCASAPADLVARLYWSPGRLCDAHCAAPRSHDAALDHLAA